jgi:hypothetical protein
MGMNLKDRIEKKKIELIQATEQVRSWQMSAIKLEAQLKELEDILKEDSCSPVTSLTDTLQAVSGQGKRELKLN